MEVEISNYKVCTRCKVGKPLEEFPVGHHNKNGKLAHCKQCHNAIGRTWHANNIGKYAEQRRRYKIRARYGLTVEEYDALRKEPEDGCKQCSGCKTRKPFNAFHKNKRSSDGFQCACIVCNVSRSKSYKARHPERVKARERRKHLRVNYGFDPVAYEALLQSQGGVCKICHCVCSSGRRLAIDHDHATGRIRGLLCMACNRALGLVHEKPYVLRRMIEYLETP